MLNFCLDITFLEVPDQFVDAAELQVASDLRELILRPAQAQPHLQHLAPPKEAPGR
jgi:hypothetical protein